MLGYTPRLDEDIQLYIKVCKKKESHLGSSPDHQGASTYHLGFVPQPNLRIFVFLYKTYAVLVTNLLTIVEHIRKEAS
ncbi:hypothetical protein NUACC21_66620 [Scytonema sp. NUACC21]